LNVSSKAVNFNLSSGERLAKVFSFSIRSVRFKRISIVVIQNLLVLIFSAKYSLKVFVHKGFSTTSGRIFS
jgi:hypothetical protein